MRWSVISGLLGLGLIALGFSPKGAEWPKPQKQAGSIGIYERFEDLEAIFHFDNDTTYVINFWATWCGPCVKELPYFEQIHQQYAEQKVRVILISLDFPAHVETSLVQFVKKKKLSPTVVALLDGKFNRWIDKVDPSWGGSIPVTMIYQGERKHFIDSEIEKADELEEIIHSFQNSK
ncbi:MAG: TlpA disulfide reductase family protein [Bacteroidota bacterium]